MGYRRLLILRKDLQMTVGKTLAMVAHCSEAYWTRMIRENISGARKKEYMNPHSEIAGYFVDLYFEKEIMDCYIKDSFVKTICQARNKNHLLKAKTIAAELGLVEGVDFGEINDNCRTELTPENEDGTTLVGIWFKPLPDEVAHKISKKYHLYMD